MVERSALTLLTADISQSPCAPPRRGSIIRVVVAFLSILVEISGGRLESKSGELISNSPLSSSNEKTQSHCDINTSAPRGKNPLVFYNRRQSFVSETTDDDGQLRQARARTKGERERERTDKERGLDILYLILLKCNTITKRQTQHPNN